MMNSRGVTWPFDHWQVEVMFFMVLKKPTHLIHLFVPNMIPDFPEATFFVWDLKKQKQYQRHSKELRPKVWWKISWSPSGLNAVWSRYQIQRGSRFSAIVLILIRGWAAIFPLWIKGSHSQLSPISSQKLGLYCSRVHINCTGESEKLVIFHKITILQNSIYKQIRWLTMMNHQVWGYDIFRQIRGGVENVGWSKNDPFRSKNRWQLKPLWSFRKSSCGNPHSLSLGLEDVKKSVNPFLMLS